MSSCSEAITGNETWVHHFTPETKAASMTWKHPNSPVRKKFKVSPSAGQVMATVFWDVKGVILLDFLYHGTINAAHYCDTLTKLRSAIQRKRPGLLSEGVMLLDENAKPHAARLTQDQIHHFGWERLDHPAYSPDLAPSDFHLFPALKAHSQDVTSKTMLRWSRMCDNFLHCRAQSFTRVVSSN